MRHTGRGQSDIQVNNRSDEDILRDVIAGNTRAFEELVTRHQDTVARFVYKIVPSHEDREEICQDVFVKVYRSLNQFRFDAQFTTWLYQIAYRTAVSSTRRKRLDTDSYESDDAVASTSLATDSPERRDQRDMVNKLMATLTLEEKTIVSLHYLQDVPIADISRIVERPAGSVKNILYRSREKLHATLKRSEIKLYEAV